MCTYRLHNSANGMALATWYVGFLGMYVSKVGISVVASSNSSCPSSSKSGYLVLEAFVNKVVGSLVDLKDF